MAITALTVKITVPATNVTYNGAYNTVGGQIVDSFSGGSNLVYTFTLTPGQTISPGSFTFAAQMNGNGATHNAATDSWTATYVAGGTTYTQSGTFAGTSPTPPPPPPPPPPSFTLSDNPGSLSITQGASGAATISITPSGGFNGAVAFAVTGLPAGVTATFNSASAPSSTSLTLSAGAGAPLGASNLTITGTSGALSADGPRSRSPSTEALRLPGGWVQRALSARRRPTVRGSTKTTSSSPRRLRSPRGTVTITVPAANVSYNGDYNAFGGQILNGFTGGANLVYSFTLSPGQTIAPGSFTFAAEMNGNGTTHDVTGDSWTATYTSGGATYTQSGTF